LRHRLRLGCLHRARSRAARGAARERQQSNVASALDGDTEPTLVTRTNAGHATGKNFAALLHKLGKDVGTLVVDQVHFLDAKLADFFLAEKLPLAAARSTWTAARATGAGTFAACTTATTGTTLATSNAASVTTVAAMPTLSAATTWSAGTR
jgi:hypothetical protein